MNLNKLFLPALFLSASFLMFASCDKTDPKSEEPVIIKSIDDLVVSDNFNFDMLSAKNIRVTAQDLYGNNMPGVRIEIYTDFSEETNNGNLILSGITNAQGKFETEFPLSNITGKLFIVTGHIGLPTVTETEVTNTGINVLIGGAPSNSSYKSSFEYKSITAGYEYLCAHNNSGVPQCLINPRDVIDADMLADINAALPDRAPVPQYHPEYLANANQTDVHLLETADVWITMVHEGAGNKNTIGFYTYEVSNPPASANEIDIITIAFPNFSLAGSGGGLYPGDKVYIGQFPAGTGIGWVMLASGFTGNHVNTNKVHYYSNPDFNPENTPGLRQHNVLLFDAERDKFLIGFEDINRQLPVCDNDFNDAVFYVTSNPVEAIDNSNMPLVDPTLADTDGDGISDVLEDYPNDPLRAFNNYFPGNNQSGGLAFEDLWPQKGDYDFNDLVITYQINQVTNADNHVVEIISTNSVKAIGAGYKNGFGFQLNVPPSAVSSVTGFVHTENIISLNPNNTEAGQNLATIIPFDNTYSLFDNVSQGYVNTKEGMPFHQPQNLTTVITFATPQSIDAIGLPPYNPFLIINKERGKEVHLPSYPPTSLADPSYFGTFDDDTNLSTGKYYKSKNNLPWAMLLPEEFDYPVEKASIVETHLVFGNWVISSGNDYKDWFKDRTGYRNPSKIYSGNN